MQELDRRIVRVSIEVNGKIKVYDGLSITATGTKYANANQNEAEITIYNLDKTTQDYILTETSPYNLNRTQKTVVVEAGRESYGTAIIYSGNIVSSRPSQPPDIGINLKCLTGNFSKGSILSRSMPGTVPLSTLCGQVAQDLQRTLIFQADNKNISNYTFTGGALKQVDYLASIGGVNAFIDNSSLIIKNIGKALSNTVKILNLDTGMIGIPELTAEGIRVKFLLDNRTTLGGGLDVKSISYPAANGTYIIYKLSFDIANRETPFYWIAEGVRLST